MSDRLTTLLTSTKPVIPVVKMTDSNHAEPLADALLEGGLRTIEITLRSPVALKSIERMRRSHPDLIVGAGTILTTDQYNSAIRAGAEFVISPGCTEDLVHNTDHQDIPFIPGTLTPSDMMLALAANLNLVKLFPANAFDTTRYLKSLAGPFPSLRFCPTGGLNADNTDQVLALANVFAAGGTWITPTQTLHAEDWDTIKGLAAKAKALEVALH